MVVHTAAVRNPSDLHSGLTRGLPTCTGLSGGRSYGRSDSRRRPAVRSRTRGRWAAGSIRSQAGSSEDSRRRPAVRSRTRGRWAAGSIRSQAGSSEDSRRARSTSNQVDHNEMVGHDTDTGLQAQRQQDARSTSNQVDHNEMVGHDTDTGLQAQRQQDARSTVRAVTSRRRCSAPSGRLDARAGVLDDAREYVRLRAGGGVPHRVAGSTREPVCSTTRVSTCGYSCFKFSDAGIVPYAWERPLYQAVRRTRDSRASSSVTPGSSPMPGNARCTKRYVGRGILVLQAVATDGGGAAATAAADAAGATVPNHAPAPPSPPMAVVPRPPPPPTPPAPPCRTTRPHHRRHRDEQHLLDRCLDVVG